MINLRKFFGLDLPLRLLPFLSGAIFYVVDVN
jgi:hypothetical protein